MPTYYFDLIDHIKVTDKIGHSCKDAEEAHYHGDFIAQRIGTEKPEVASIGIYISVRNDEGEEIYRAPIRSAKEFN